MKKIGLALLLSTTLAFADNTDDLNNFREKFKNMLKNSKVEKIERSPIKGLYEVILENGNILYSDGRYLIIGHILTFKGEDLTQEKIDSLKAKKISQIDLSKALKIGNGKQKVIEISDPECPFCRKAEKLLKNKDITRYIFFMPLPFHKLAKPLAIHILCSDVPEKEYLKVMEGKLDNQTLKYCQEGEKRLEEMEKIARELKIKGTPTFWIYKDGKWIKIEGANPRLDEILKKKEK